MYPGHFAILGSSTTKIRDKFSSLKDEAARMSFLEQFGGNAQIASALLSGPAGLTNLSGAERAVLRSKVEGHVDPEIIAARAATAEALREAEEAWTRGGSLIAKRGGLHKGVDGGWSQPADVKNAAA